ncbi:MAG: fumarylacetoacetate hydrolase family protein [Proteobacteria bacterium]|nr:fumarylacetoacetate hydrolase family protein [Pseudomonadota bacterium]
MRFVISPAEPVCLKIAGSEDLFPVNRAFCIGRNYADHAIEMGGNPDREEPFFFMKPASAIIPSGGRLPYPSATENLHHEVELVVAIARGGGDIPVEGALDCVFGYAVGIDLTRRDLQEVAKKAGRPWDMAKGFDASGPIGTLTPVATCGHVADAAISLSVGGAVRQSGNVNQMIWKTAEAIAYLSRLVEIRPGDLMFTGTPAGVGPIARGERVHCEIAGLVPMDCQLV